MPLQSMVSAFITLTVTRTAHVLSVELAATTSLIRTLPNVNSAILSLTASNAMSKTSQPAFGATMDST